MAQDAAAARAQAAVLQQRRKEQEQMIERGRKESQLFIDFGGGVGGFARTVDEAKGLRDKARARAAFLVPLMELREMAKGGGTWDAAKIGKANSLYNKSMAAIGQAQEMQAMSGSEEDRARAQLGSLPTDYAKWDGRTVAAIDATINGTIAENQAIIQASRLSPAREHMTAAGPIYERLPGSAQPGGQGDYSQSEGAPVE